MYHMIFNLPTETPMSAPVLQTAYAYSLLTSVTNDINYYPTSNKIFTYQKEATKGTLPVYHAFIFMKVMEYKPYFLLHKGQPVYITDIQPPAPSTNIVIDFKASEAHILDTELKQENITHTLSRTLYIPYCSPFNQSKSYLTPNLEGYILSVFLINEEVEDFTDYHTIEELKSIITLSEIEQEILQTATVCIRGLTL